MQIKKTRWILGTTAALAGATLALGAALPASADPGGTPAPRLLTGTGSDTTQDLNNGLAAVVTGDHDGVASTTAQRIIGSWNATGSATINPNGTSYNRPNGSSNGVAALRSAKDATTLWGGLNLATKDAQFARSSSAPSTTALDPTGAYSYVPLAVDAVTYARHTTNTLAGTDIPLGGAVGDDTDGDGIRDLTLKNIFGQNPAGGSGIFTLEATTGTVTRTVGTQASGAQIVPFKPQAGSGTLSFWTSTIGGLGLHVSDTYTVGSATSSVQEHDGAVLNASAALRASAIVPFSIAQYIAQERVGANSAHFTTPYGVTVADRRNGAVLNSIDGVTPRTSTTGPLNTSFPVKRPVFTVVSNAEYNSTAPAGQLPIGQELRATFGPSGKAYTALRPGTTTTVLQDFGFGSLGTNGTTFTINGAQFAAVKAGEVTSRFRAN